MGRPTATVRELLKSPHQLHGRKINPPPGSDFLPWLCKQYHHYSCLAITLSKTLDIQSPLTHTGHFADEVQSLKSALNKASGLWEQKQGCPICQGPAPSTGTL